MRIVQFGLALFFALGPFAFSALAEVTELHAGRLQMSIESRGFRFGFQYDGRTVVSAHGDSGLLLGSDPIAKAEKSSCSLVLCTFEVVTTNGAKGKVTVGLKENHVQMDITESEPRSSILVRTAGLKPAYGLGDRTIWNKHDDTNISGLIEDRLHAGPSQVRLMSNLVIFPQQGMAEVIIEPDIKILHLTDQENAQGVPSAPHGVQVHFFFGDPHEIYNAFRDVRTESGYPLLTPKYEMFGVGWEAFGALGWTTSQETVQQNIDRYRAQGFPIQWAVIGSGFWPQGAKFEETTSFGMWNKEKYPDPTLMIKHLHEENIRVLLGLRIAFITDGPYSSEGVSKGYFLKANGTPMIFKVGSPRYPCYLLDTQNREAVSWYIGLVEKWHSAGIDGYKEDLYGYGRYDLRDDKLDAINRELMAKGVLIIERNGYLGSAGDLDRIEDFNYDQDQDRGPVNLLALAYAGLPLGYPDIVGGTFAEDHFDTKVTQKMQVYMMRNAQWASLHSSMSMGQPPWTFPDPKVGEVMLKAAKLHEQLHPYIYSQAVAFVHDGYPWSMTPLPIAFPHDPNVYGRENRTVRGYEWMIGDSLLATPLYGDDYDTSNTRDVYLPKGKWIDYETGEVYQGPTMLKNFRLPVEKTPLFVGGSGVIVEQSGDRLVLRVYPISFGADSQFWGGDGVSHSAISIRTRDWKNPQVFDKTANRVVPGTWERFAYQTPLIVGHAYEIR